MSTSLLTRAVSHGFLLSFLLTSLLLISQLVNPEIMLNDYPSDVRKAYGSPRSPHVRWQRAVASLTFILITTLVLTASFRALSSPIRFFEGFVNVLVVFMTFNVVDLLIIDWLIFVRLQPAFLILPGTEGLAGYSDYWFHFRAFLKGTVMIAILSAAIAGGAVLFQFLF